MGGGVDRDMKEEVEKAFRLFTGGGDGPIRLDDLRRVAEDLKEEVTEEQLRDMMEEASSGALGRGVSLRDFEGVMRKAGVF